MKMGNPTDDTMTTAKTWGGHRPNAGRKPAPPHISRQNLIINVRDLTPQQRETLIALINEWLAQQKAEAK